MKNRGYIVVTGGAGFIGSHLASRLVADGYRVTVLDNLSTGKLENIPEDANFINVDLGDKEAYDSLKNLACKVDAVFHLAGQSSGEASFKDPFYDLRSHVYSTFWLLDWCKQKGVDRFIYSSSMAIYGDPQYLPVDENHPIQPKTFYAAAKAAAEAYIRLYQTLNINTTIFRLFSVYGPGQNLDNKMQGMVSIFLSYMLENIPIVVKGSKDRFRDFLYIDDLIDAWMLAYKEPKTYGKVYNLSSGIKTTVGDLLGILKKEFGCKDYPIEYKNNTPGDQFGVVANITHITKEIGWVPETDIRIGLNRMVSFEKRRLKIE